MVYTGTVFYLGNNVDIAAAVFVQEVAKVFNVFLV